MDNFVNPDKYLSKTHYEKRYNRLQLLMEQKGITHFLIEDPIDVSYFTGYYFSSVSFLANVNFKPDLMVDSRYFDALKEGYWRAHLIDKGFWVRFWQRGHIKSLGFDPDKTTYARFHELSDQTLDAGIRLTFHKHLPGTLQRVKDSDQINKMKAAGLLATKGLQKAIRELNEGVTEQQIAKSIRLFFLDNCADISFEPIVAFGEHTAVAHHSASDKRLQEGDLVMIDLGAKLNRYCSDMTRTFFYKRVGSQELVKLWHEAYMAFRLVADMLKVGVSCQNLDRAARDYFKLQGLEGRFTHSLGHGIGLRVHEFPRIRADIAGSEYQLEEGSIFTIEPGLYLPQLGGVRHEDSFALTSEGLSILTPFPFDMVVS